MRDKTNVLRSSQILVFARLRSGRPGKLPYPVEDQSAENSPAVLAQVSQATSGSATGSQTTIRRELGALIAKHRPDEIIIAGMIHDRAARLNLLKSLPRRCRILLVWHKTHSKSVCLILKHAYHDNRLFLLV